MLFVFLVLKHRPREVLHFNVIEHPTSAWVAQQIVEAFADRETPRYLIRDRDGVYGTEVPRRLKSMGIAEVLTAPQSPWQNAYAERLIGSIRRECLNHFIILNSRHLKKALASYFRYHHRSRPHVALSKQCPIERQVMKDGAIVAIAELEDFIIVMSVLRREAETGRIIGEAQLDSTAPPDPAQTRRNAGTAQEISIMPVPKLDGPESDNAQQSIQFVMEPSEDVCFSG